MRVPRRQRRDRSVDAALDLTTGSEMELCDHEVRGRREHRGVSGGIEEHPWAFASGEIEMRAEPCPAEGNVVGKSWKHGEARKSRGIRRRSRNCLGEEHARTAGPGADPEMARCLRTL